MTKPSRLFGISGSMIFALAILFGVGAWLGSPRHASATTRCVGPGSVGCFSTISAVLIGANATAGEDVINITATEKWRS